MRRSRPSERARELLGWAISVPVFSSHDMSGDIEVVHFLGVGGATVTGHSVCECWSNAHNKCVTALVTCG